MGRNHGVEAAFLPVMTHPLYEERRGRFLRCLNAATFLSSSFLGTVMSFRMRRSKAWNSSLAGDGVVRVVMHVCYHRCRCQIKAFANPASRVPTHHHQSRCHGVLWRIRMSETPMRFHGPKSHHVGFDRYVAPYIASLRPIAAKITG